MISRIKDRRQQKDADFEDDDARVTDGGQGVKGRWGKDEGEEGPDAAEEVDREEDERDADHCLRRGGSALVESAAVWRLLELPNDFEQIGNAQERTGFVLPDFPILRQEPSNDQDGSEDSGGGVESLVPIILQSLYAFPASVTLIY